MKINLFFLIFMLFTGAAQATNLTMKITNSTGYSCNFKDINLGNTISFAVGETKSYTFQSSPVSYSFGPNVPNYTPVFANGDINYNKSNNYLYLSSNSTPYYTNKTGFQLYLQYSDSSTAILNKNAAIAQGLSVSTIGAQPFSSGSISTVPFSVNFILNETGAVQQTEILLTNNSNHIITDLIFRNSGGETLYSLDNLNEYSSTSIPNNSSALQCVCGSLHDSLVTIPVTANMSSNIYGSGSIINTTNQTVYLTYSGYIINLYSSLLNITPISLTALEQQVILSAANSLNISSSKTTNDGNLLRNQTINPNETYYLTYTSGIWNLSTNAPTTLPTSFTNNTGYSCNLVDQSTNTTVTIPDGQTKVYTFTSNSVSYSFGPNATTSNGNKEGGNILYNSTNNSIYFTNDSPYSWVNQTNQAGGTGFQVYLNDGSKTILNVGQSTGGVIPYEIGAQPYSTSNTTPPSTATFTLNATTGAVQIAATYSSTILNNYKQTTGTISFNGTTSSIPSLNSWTYTNIPNGTTSITCSGLVNGGNFTILPEESLNIYTDPIITNTTDAYIFLDCYSGTVNIGGYGIYPNQSVPIVTNVNYVTNNETISSNLDALTSYLISYDNFNNLQITSYTPLIKNNYTEQITNLNFYNSNNQLTDSISYLDAAETYETPTTSSLANFAIPNLSALTIFTMPIEFPELLNMVTDNTITNNSGQNVQVNYFGNNNFTTSALLTSSPISPIVVNQAIPISMGALNAQILDADGNEVIASSNGPLSPGINYYIIYDEFASPQWSLSSTAPETFSLINNSLSATGTITFKNSSSGTISSIDSLLAGASYPFPFGTVSVECTGLINNGTGRIAIPSETNVNIYSNYALTNNSMYEVTAYYYTGSTPNQVVSGSVVIPASTSSILQYVPIITGTTVISTNQIAAQDIVTTSSYIINFDDPTWTMTAYIPRLNNNSSQNGTNLVFKDGNGSTISSTQTSISAYNTATVPINAASVSIFIYNSTIEIATSLAANSYLFTNNTITNLANQTANVTFYSDTVNDAIPTLNNPGISIQASQNCPRITSGTSLSVTAGNISVINSTPLLENTSYFINYDVNAFPQWWLSTENPSTDPLFTNNYNQAITNLQFYYYDNPEDPNYTSSVAIPPLITELEAWDSTTIPDLSDIALFTATYNSIDSNIYVPVTDTVTSNIFTGYVITNHTEQDVDLWFYNASPNATLNNPGIRTLPSQSNPILTGAYSVSITNTTYTDGIPTEIYIDATPLSANTSYYIIYDATATPQWQLVATLPTQDAYLTNNYNETALNLNFRNSSNIVVGTPNQSLNAYHSTQIPSDATSVQLLYFDNSTLTLPVSGSASSTLFTNYYVINDAGTNFEIKYYNGSTLLNQPEITSTDSQYRPIITSATNFIILDNEGTQQINQAIAANTDYTITNTWTVIPSTPARLTNNSGQDATDLTFYNGSTPVGSITNPFYNWTAADIPTGATKATTSESFNTIASNLTVSVSDTLASNLVTDYYLYNNSSDTVSVVFSGTINSVSNQPLNTPGISMSPFSLPVPITTGAVSVSVTINNIEEISDAIIEPNTTYYINYINGIWRLDTYASIVTLTNNSSTDASLLIFYDTNDAVMTVNADFDPYTSQPTPTSARYASADFETPYNSTLTIPVTGAANGQYFNTTNSVIANSTSNTNLNGTTGIAQSIGLIFYGTINNTPNVAFNSPTIDMSTNESVQILTGPDNFTIYDSNNNPVIVNYPIEVGQSYSVYNYYDANNSLIWAVNQHTYAATLTNNYDEGGTSLKFFNSTTTLDSSTQIDTTQTTFPAFSSPGIPTDAIIAQFDIFGSTLTFPVSATTSSNVYANILYNKTGGAITVTYYGTVGGVSDTQLNNSPISIADEDIIPFLVATDYMIIVSGINTLNTTTTIYNPISGTTAYDIVYNPSLNIIPHQINLTNNFYSGANSINFYDSNGSFISTLTDVQPFATVTIPENALSADIDYTDYSVKIPLSAATSVNVLTNNILTNNSNDDLFVNFYDINGHALSTENLVLVIGSAIPFITGTYTVNVFIFDGISYTGIILNQVITPVDSYEIRQANNQFRLFRATSTDAEIQTASSALGTIRFLGGSTPPELALKNITVYGKNRTIFQEFLYVDVYAQVISDLTARAAVKLVINTMLDTYATNNINNQFNFISYVPQINDQLRIAQIALRSQYPNSTQEIDLFFRYLLKRNNSTLFA